MPGLKQHNEYERLIGEELYAKTPKAVLAAIVASFCSVGGDYPESVPDGMLREWTILHDNGIVPQKPPRRVEYDSHEEER
jgi:hypothetical protein